MDCTSNFYIVDVFGEKRFSGNQLAVFLDAGHLSDDEMQLLAREMNYSETTFVLSGEPGDAGYDVRIFTPEKELDFAGHPTIGTAFIIQKHIIKEPVEKVVLNLKAGQIPVTFSGERESGMLWMDHVEPTFGDMFDANIFTKILDLPLDAIDNRYPIHEISTGLPHIIVPLRNLDALKKAKVVKDEYFEFIRTTWAKCILVFCPRGYDESHDMGVRMFADYYGIEEDPATGSGNGCLAAYLVKHRYLQTEEINIKTGQGHELGRPSLLSLAAKEVSGVIHVSVGGKVFPVIEGRLL